jgi:hypothetical protein
MLPVISLILVQCARQLGYKVQSSFSSVSSHILGVVPVCGTTGLHTSIQFSSVSCHIPSVVPVCGTTGLHTSIQFSSVSCHILGLFPVCGTTSLHWFHTSIQFSYVSFHILGVVPVCWTTVLHTSFHFSSISCHIPGVVPVGENKWVTNFILVFILFPVTCDSTVRDSWFPYFHSIFFCFLSYPVVVPVCGTAALHT